MSIASGGYRMAATGGPSLVFIIPPRFDGVSSAPHTHVQGPVRATDRRPCRMSYVGVIAFQFDPVARGLELSKVQCDGRVSRGCCFASIDFFFDMKVLC
jgi:hypothetical protein